MSAQLQEVHPVPDYQVIAEWAAQTEFNLQQVHCLIAIMLKILDGKCRMDAETQYCVQIIYRNAHRGRSHLFSTDIHRFIEQTLQQADSLSLGFVRELRLYAESAIAKTRMKRFKQYLWDNMPYAQ